MARPASNGGNLLVWVAGSWKRSGPFGLTPASCLAICDERVGARQDLSPLDRTSRDEPGGQHWGVAAC